MAVTSSVRFSLGLVACLVLAGCEDFNLGSMLSPDAAPEETTAPAEDNPRVGGSVRVVEAPEVFDVTDTALWDGRPSLGLIWVAYEGADPHNVIIRNTENDKFVVGALYRRERFFPGPPFQMSSEAAAELGILAGRPTQVRVTALKEERAEPEPGAEEPVGEDGAAETAVAEADVELSPPPSAGAAELDPIAAAAAAAIESADPEVQTAALEPAPRPTVEGPNAPLPRSLPLPAPEPAEETQAEIPEPTGSALAPAVSEPLEDPIPAPSPEVTNLSRPFIQVGIFSARENAEEAAEGLRGDGIIPLVEEQRIGGRTFFRVVVGPARNSSERAALLDQIKAQGFADAYFVAN